jgi:hypothetical protein
MRTLLRRLRGVATTASLWAPAWALFGAAVAVRETYGIHRWHRMYWGMNCLTSPRPVTSPWRSTTGGGATWERRRSSSRSWGPVSGAVFAVVLAAFEQRRALGQLAMRRVALWGALGGVTMPLVLVSEVLASPARLPGDRSGQRWLVMSLLMGALGAACSTATLALARRSVPEGGGR